MASFKTRFMGTRVSVVITMTGILVCLSSSGQGTLFCICRALLKTSVTALPSQKTRNQPYRRRGQPPAAAGFLQGAVSWTIHTIVISAGNDKRPPV
ncbi:hypothetical protein V8C34DRAFT_276136, partial [Trichoderma compactum]